MDKQLVLADFMNLTTFMETFRKWSRMHKQLISGRCTMTKVITSMTY